MEIAMPAVVYHYCSLPTFLKIFKTRTLWLSDISKSNDSMELKWVYLQYRDLLNKNIDNLDNEAKKEIPLVNMILDVWMEKIHPTWCVCFSEKGDLLSQWRAYSDDGRGLSIGFDSSILGRIGEILGEIYIRFGKINYNIWDLIRPHFNPKPIEMYKSIVSPFSQFSTNFSIIDEKAPFYKNPSFQEECEWRLALSYRDISKISDPISKEVAEKLAIQKVKIGSIDFETIRDQSVSHFDLIFYDFKNAIKEIVIGPKSKETIESIKLFLISQGLLDDMDDNSIKVIKSTSSYQ